VHEVLICEAEKEDPDEDEKIDEVPAWLILQPLPSTYIVDKEEDLKLTRISQTRVKCNWELCKMRIDPGSVVSIQCIFNSSVFFPTLRTIHPLLTKKKLHVHVPKERKTKYFDLPQPNIALIFSN
jgi:hypothetical protein